MDCSARSRIMGVRYVISVSEDKDEGEVFSLRDTGVRSALRVKACRRGARGEVRFVVPGVRRSDIAKVTALGKGGPDAGHKSYFDSCKENREEKQGRWEITSGRSIVISIHRGQLSGS